MEGKNRKTRLICFGLLVLSSAIFFGFLALMNKEGGSKNIVVTITWLVSIFLGIFSFIGFTSSFITQKEKLKDTEKRKGKKKTSSSIITVVLSVLGTLFVLALIHFGSDYLRLKEESNKPKPSSSLNVTLTPTVAIYRQEIQTTDPIINCQIQTDCGGGSRQMKQSECNTMTCCHYWSQCGGSKWVSKSVCEANNFCCVLSNGTGVLVASKEACDNYSPKSSGSSPIQQDYIFPTLTTGSTTITTQTVNTSDNTQARKKCISEVNATIDGNISRYCNNKEIYPSDTSRNGCIAQQEQQRAKSNAHCHDLYP